MVAAGAAAQTSAKFNTLAYYPGTQIDWEEAGVSLRVPPNFVGLWQLQDTKCTAGDALRVNLLRNKQLDIDL